MSEFLKTSELTESLAFIRTFVKEIVASPGKSASYYTIPLPDDSRIPGSDAEAMALERPELSTVSQSGPEMAAFKDTQTMDHVKVEAIGLLAD